MNKTATTGLSFGERKLFEHAFSLITTELAAAWGYSEEDVRWSIKEALVKSDKN